MISENISLKGFNTFCIDASARYFSVFHSVSELNEILEDKKFNNGQPGTRKLVLGGGSNLLFTKDFNGLVLKNEIRGIEKIKEDDQHIYIRAGGGENWHQLVMHCIDNNWAGVENLALIPGNAGASPMQNIGAYGVEIKDVFYELEAFHIGEKKTVTFNSKDCSFDYRESVFKNKLKNQFVILTVTYRLNKYPTINTSYGAIEQELERMNVTELTIRAITEAVVNIRKSKLPNPTEIGNAGSFFKNPTIPGNVFDEMKHIFPGIIGYEARGGKIKVAAGWLIEQCGWKGYRKGDAGCSEKQALVLVNYGNAKGTEIIQLSEDIMQSVQQKFSIELEREVNIV